MSSQTEHKRLFTTRIWVPVIILQGLFLQILHYYGKIPLGAEFLSIPLFLWIILPNVGLAVLVVLFNGEKVQKVKDRDEIEADLSLDVRYREVCVAFFFMTASHAWNWMPLTLFAIAYLAAQEDFRKSISVGLDKVYDSGRGVDLRNQK